MTDRGIRMCEREKVYYNKLWSKVSELRGTYFFSVSFQLVSFSNNPTWIRFSLALGQYWLSRIHTSPFIHPCLKTVWQQTFHVQRQFYSMHFWLFRFPFFFFNTQQKKNRELQFCSHQPHIKFPFDRQRLITHMKPVNVCSFAICFSCVCICGQSNLILLAVDLRIQ